MAVTAWTKHLETEDEKKQYVESLHRARWVFDRLRDLITENMNSIELGETSPSAYNNPNWPYRQAHANGYKQALREYLKLITLDQGEEDGRQPPTRNNRRA